MLFRSRWFALAWVVFMTVSGVLFATTGTGAVLTGTAPRPSASNAATSDPGAFNPLAEDEPTEDPNADPLSAGATLESHGNTAPYTGADNASGDNASADNSSANVSQ